MSANKIALRAIVASALIALAGCATHDGDGAGHRQLNPNRIDDAVPKEEPQVRAGNPPVYVIKGKQYRTLKSHRGFKQAGYASWYGTKFHGRNTSNGEKYDMYAMTAAHKTLPIPCYVRVTRQDNGKSIVVRVNDRGPFVDGRIIDLSYAAATKLGITLTGTAKVHIEAIDVGKHRNKNLRRTAPLANETSTRDSVYRAPPTSASATSFEPASGQAPAAAPPPKKPASAPLHAQLPRGYFVQVAAFRSFDSSLITLKRYRDLGLQPMLVQLEETNFPFKLWIGPLENKAESVAVQTQLRNQGLEPGFIVRN
jgi:rare lipoprotein A